jgi:serine phosphatase RsbU (regulator of sigma subunit)
MPREALLARTLVELADTLVDDFDVVELLTMLTDRCVEVLDVAAAGLMLAYPGGELRVMASSSDAMRLLELFELQSEEGPCPDCYRTGKPIVNHRLTASGGPWPRFGPRAVEAGFRSVHALPMRLRDVTIGALNLFRTDEGALNDADVAAAQALADVATITVLHHHAASDARLVNEQLHHALNSRVVIEQAKGVVAERAGLDMSQAFSALRNHARSHNLRLVDVAEDVIAGTLAARSLDGGDPLPRPTAPTERLAALTEALVALGGIAPVLDMVEAVSPVDAVEVVVSELAATLGAEQVSFLIADLSGDALVRFVRPVPGRGRDPAASEALETLAIAGTPYEQALVSQRVQIVADGDRYRLFAPVADRGDALGVLELVLGSSPADDLVGRVASAAHVLAYVVIANRRHTDLFESVQRDSAFSLAAEIQRQLLPSAFTCATEHFTFAGWLEPASHVGGDTFDYAVDHDQLHASMTDAMGHGVQAALLATLALGSLRNTRRSDVGLAEQARQANDAMISHAEGDQFVTGLLLRADLRSGRVVAVNAGHPHPYRLRGGRAECLELAADLPFGMIPGSTYREQELRLEPGDRLVVVTDGFLERNAAAADFDVVAAVADTAALHPREVVHVFKAEVLTASGAELADDAAVLCLDWHGSPPAPSPAQGRPEPGT